MSSRSTRTRARSRLTSTARRGVTPRGDRLATRWTFENAHLRAMAPPRPIFSTGDTIAVTTRSLAVAHRSVHATALTAPGSASASGAFNHFPSGNTNSLGNRNISISRIPIANATPSAAFAIFVQCAALAAFLAVPLRLRSSCFNFPRTRSNRRSRTVVAASDPTAPASVAPDRANDRVVRAISRCNANTGSRSNVTVTKSLKQSRRRNATKTTSGDATARATPDDGDASDDMFDARASSRARVDR